ncbi:MAG: Phenylalanine-tRNA ligase beta subunit [Microgenomates group bacterium GW2011_GWF2_47_9]|nr:MAG: Phenylalanine-tRNA ligase beta subunit [Microgenomates group bacterium GW2011_GWF2_47_9]
MKIPLIWLKDYVEIEKSPREVADSFTKIGLMLDKPVGEDQVLDLEQRLNRSDLLSILGCARDYAVFENLKLKAPKIKLNKTLPADLKSKIEIKVNTPAVRRFNTGYPKGSDCTASTASIILLISATSSWLNMVKQPTRRTSPN